MKAKFFGTVLFSVILLVVFQALTSCLKDENINGYIPVDQKPVLTWKEAYPGSGSYYSEMKVMVITEKDTIFALSYRGNYHGWDIVDYRDSHPLSVGKKVYVSLNKFEEGYYIWAASLEPIKF